MAARTVPTEIGIVVYPGAQLFAIHGLTDLFSIANRFTADDGPRPGPRLAVSHWGFGAEERAVSCVYSSEPRTERQLAALILPPTMVDLPDAETRERLARWLSGQHADGVRLVSICSGVALLAESGLLDGRTVSTHRNFVPFLSRHYPEVTVDLDARIIEYPDILTAGGFMSWLDVGLLIVERLLGDRVREETARFMLSDSARTGQPDASPFMPPFAHGDLAVRRAQQQVHLKDGQGISLKLLATAAGLERRTLLRRFTEATGLSPIAYCRAVRIARACDLLDAGKLSQKEIAERLGYVDVSSFARAFRRTQGIAPGAFRRRNAAPPPEPAARLSRA
jgi:transcriptional regulator GlxA family with amidase domain